MNLTLNEKIKIAFIIFTVMVFLLSFPEKKLTNAVKIGVSDDSSGIVIDYIMKSKDTASFERQEDYESYFISDC